MNIVQQELDLYRAAMNEIDDRIEYRGFDRAAIHEIMDRLAIALYALHAETHYTITDAGRKALAGGE